MEENRDKELDAFIKKIVNEVGLEKPSVNFTDAVLSKVQVAVLKGSTGYTPLISKSAWFIMAVSTVAVIVYMIFGDATIEIPWVSSLIQSIPTDNSFFNAFSNVKISETFLFATVGLTIFIGIQIFLLKHQFEKHYVLE